MEPHNRDHIDRRLDSLLQRYGQVEPRPGLENRILATVRAQAARTRWPRGWAWSLAGLSSAVLLILVWSGVGHRYTGNRESSAAGRAPETKNSAHVAAQIPSDRLPPGNGRTRRVQPAPAVARVREQRLDQFPSRRPLSAQELALADYAQRFPQEAMLLAKQQARFEEEIQKAEQEFEKSSPVREQER